MNFVEAKKHLAAVSDAELAAALESLKSPRALRGILNLYDLCSEAARRLQERPRRSEDPDFAEVGMTKDEFDSLDTGDVVRHVHGREGYVVHGNYGTYVTAADVVHMSNHAEWQLVSKAVRT